MTPAVAAAFLHGSQNTLESDAGFDLPVFLGRGSEPSPGSPGPPGPHRGVRGSLPRSATIRLALGHTHSPLFMFKT